MQNATVSYLAEQCGFKEAYIRQLLIAGKKLQGSKPDGKAWAVDLDLPINREFFNKHRKATEQNTVINTEDTPEIRNRNTVELSPENTPLIRDLIKQITEYAEEKGRVKQLTDTLMQKEHDVDFWKNKYFELQYKYETLLKENTELKTRKWWNFKVI